MHRTVFIRRLYSCRFVVLVVFLSSCSVLYAQQESANDSTDKNFQLIPVPYLSYDRTLGFSFGAVPMAMYRLNKRDTISERSLSGIVGFYTTNKSWFGMAFTRLNFGQGNWRTVAAYGIGNYNFQFYLAGPIGTFIPYTTGAQFLIVSVQRRIVSDLFAGLNYSWAKLDTEFDTPIPITTDVTLNGLGLNLAWDNRDSLYYPRRGIESKVTHRSFPEFLGNEFVSQRIEIEYNHFFPVFSARDVVAGRIYGGFGIGELTFNQQFVIGNKDIRGYTQGEYRGDQTLAIQGEYRWNLHRKISVVGFAGIAMVFDAVNEEDSGKILPGGGLGARYNVFPASHMNVGLDVAVGLDDWGIYFRIGEAF